jgi:hypothetical protein
MKGWLKKLGSDKQKGKGQKHKRSESSGSEELPTYFEQQQDDWVVAYALATSASEFESYGQGPFQETPTVARSAADEASFTYWRTGWYAARCTLPMSGLAIKVILAVQLGL